MRNVPALPCAVQIYTRPTYELFEMKLARLQDPVWSVWNTSMRFLVTTAYTVIITAVRGHSGRGRCCEMGRGVDTTPLTGRRHNPC
jgi:hypothetical protein